MAVKYHINPETGKIGTCTATVRDCLFAVDGKIPEHFPNKEEARSFYERTNKKKNFTSISKSAGNREQKELSDYEKEKQAYHKQQAELGKQRKEQIEKKQREILKRKDKQEKFKKANEFKARSMDRLEEIIEQEEALKNDKRLLKDPAKTQRYIDILGIKSLHASSIERNAIKARENSTEDNKHASHLSVEDAELFEKETYKDEYKTLLELRKVIKDKKKNNPFEAIKRIRANSRGVITRKDSVIRSINYRLREIESHSYRWRYNKAGRRHWKEFEASIEHLLDEDEK